MKLFIKFLVVILVLGLAGPFILKRPDGRPWMQVSDMVPTASQWRQQAQQWWSNASDGNVSDSVDKLSGETSDITGVSGLGKTKVYRWRDEHGNLVYSDEPRADGNHEIVVLGENQTVVPATKMPQAEPPAGKETAQGGEIAVPLPLTASPQEISQLMDDAQEVRHQMETRTQAIESAVEGSK